MISCHGYRTWACAARSAWIHRTRVHTCAYIVLALIAPTPLYCTAKVLDTCLGMGVPVAGLVGGGYHADLRVLALRHTLLHEAADQLWRDHGL